MRKNIFQIIFIFLTILNAQNDYSLEFNGQNDYVELGTPVELDFMLSMSFSISSWVYVDINSIANGPIYMRGTSTGSTDSFILLSRSQYSFNFSVRNKSNSAG